MSLWDQAETSSAAGHPVPINQLYTLNLIQKLFLAVSVEVYDFFP